MILVLDVGGTKIKYGLADGDRLLPETCGQADSHADESKEKVLEAFASLIERARPLGADRACVCMPGPFDYENGVSHMKHKFASIEGVSLRAPFESAGMDVTFVHDSTAFILGEYAVGRLREGKRPCCVMLGTGLGYAMMKNGRVWERPNHTPAFLLWNAPYLDGICEDAVSTRAIQACYGQKVPVAEIAREARNGNARAREAFLRTGEHLSEILRMIAQRFQPDICAMGGQISAASDLMQIDAPMPLYPVSNPETTARRGAAVYAYLGRDRTVTCEPLPAAIV